MGVLGRAAARRLEGVGYWSKKLRTGQGGERNLQTNSMDLPLGRTLNNKKSYTVFIN